MTGLQSIEEGERSINIILDKIKNLKGKILYNISDSYYDSNIKTSDEQVKINAIGCQQEFTHYVMKLSNGMDTIYGGR